MVNRRTVSIVGAIIVVGGLFAFAGDLDPPEGPIEPTLSTLAQIHDLAAVAVSCPQPEDIRSYFLFETAPGVEAVLIASVEGANGFMITDFYCHSCGVFEDSGGGPEEILYLNGSSDARPLKFTTGVPLKVGSVITVVTSTGEDDITLAGYCY